MEFSQGGAVDLTSYYETQSRRLQRLKIVAPNFALRQQNTVRNMSQIAFGDNYYFNGGHMFATTTKESFGPASLEYITKTRSNSPFSERLSHSKVTHPTLGFSDFPDLFQTLESEKLLEYEYLIAQAIVGTERLDELWSAIGERIKARVITGNKEFRDFFTSFTVSKKHDQDLMGPKEFHSELFLASSSLSSPACIPRSLCHLVPRPIPFGFSSLPPMPSNASHMPSPARVPKRLLSVPRAHSRCRRCDSSHRAAPVPAM